MAFADSIRTPNLNAGTLAALIESQLCSFGSSTGGSVNKTADSVYTDLCSVTIAVAAGESVLLYGQSLLCHSAIGFEVGIRLYEGATPLGQYSEFVSKIASAAVEDTCCVFHILTPAAGNHTYSLKYVGTGGAGKTVFSASSEIYWFKFRTS